MVATLKRIYKAFVNPACGSFAWVGMKNVEIILLDHFRWSPWVILLKDLRGYVYKNLIQRGKNKKLFI